MLGEGPLMLFVGVGVTTTLPSRSTRLALEKGFLETPEPAVVGVDALGDRLAASFALRGGVCVSALSTPGGVCVCSS